MFLYSPVLFFLFEVQAQENETQEQYNSCWLTDLKMFLFLRCERGVRVKIVD